MISRKRIWGFLTLAAACLICIIAFARVLAMQTSETAMIVGGKSLLRDGGLDLMPGLNMSSQLILLGFVIVMLLIFLSEFISRFLKVKKDKSLLEQKLALQNLKLQSTVEVLADRNEELKKFNYILAHDLKEPVRIINAYSGLLVQKSGENREIKNYANQVASSCKQLNRLIHDAGSYMGMETEDLDVEEVNTSALMIEVEHNLDELIEEKNATIITHDLPQLVVSRDSLSYILSSLIKNGIIYNESPNPQIIVYYKSTKNYHKFYVSDNGIGVQEEFEDQIFEMFQRLHTRDHIPGTGLGLSACSKLAKAMDGKLALHKSTEEGSTFVLKFRKTEFSEAPKAAVNHTS